MGGAIEVGECRVVGARHGCKAPNAERGKVRRGVPMLVQREEGHGKALRRSIGITCRANEGGFL